MFQIARGVGSFAEWLIQLAIIEIAGGATWLDCIWTPGRWVSCGVSRGPLEENRKSEAPAQEKSATKLFGAVLKLFVGYPFEEPAIKQPAGTQHEQERATS
jgi:hypothetical protein